MSIVFQTEGGLHSEFRESWEDMISRYHVPVSSKLHGDGDGGFHGQMRLDDWGRLQLSLFNFSSCTYYRGAREIRNAPQDDFICTLVLGGDGILQTNGSEIRFEPGDIVLYDAGRLYTVHYSNMAEVVTLRIPRALVLSRLPNFDWRSGMKMSSTAPMGRLAANTMRNLIQLDTLPEEKHCQKLEAPILDTIFLGFEEANGADLQASPGQQLLLQRIKRDISQRLDDDTLSVATIAEAHQLSTRTLNRLFAAEGTTVMRWLWTQRLSASYRAISEGKVRQVTEAAYSHGFKDSNHFSRAFKKQYKISPSELLMR